MTKAKCEKKPDKRQKKVTQEEYKDIIGSCMDGLGNPSPLAIVSVKGCERQQEGLLEVYQQQKQDQRKRGPANGWGGDLVTNDTGKAEVLDVLFVLVFTDTAYTQQLHVHVDKCGERKTSPQRRSIMPENIYNWTYLNP